MTESKHIVILRIAMKTKIIIISLLLTQYLFASNEPKAIPIFKTKSVYNGELNLIDFKENRYLIATSRQTSLLQGMMNLLDNQKLDTEVPQIMTALSTLHSKPENIFTLGLGGGSIVRHHLKTVPKLKIISAEIDPEMVEIAGKYFNTNLPNHIIVKDDGYNALKKYENKFDIIWVDTGLPKTGPKVTVKAEEIQALKHALSKNGLIIIYLGEAKEENTYEQAYKSYKGDFTSALRIKTNANQLNALMTGLKNAEILKDIPLSEQPIYFLAVGNVNTINCKDFIKNTKALNQTGITKIEMQSDLCKEI